MQTFLSNFHSKNAVSEAHHLKGRKRHWSERCLNSLLIWSHFLLIIKLRRKIFFFIHRFWWIIAFILSASLCASSIWNIWLKWNDRPVTMSFTDKEVLVSSIPFPTVTICPETKAYKEKLDVIAAYNTLKRSENLSKTE